MMFEKMKDIKTEDNDINDILQLMVKDIFTQDDIILQTKEGKGFNVIFKNFITETLLRYNPQVLNRYNKKKLQDICRRNKIKNYSLFNKNELIKLIKDEIFEKN